MNTVLLTFTTSEIAEICNDALDSMLGQAQSDGVLTPEQVQALRVYRATVYQGSFWGRFLKWLRADDKNIRLLVVRLPARSVVPPDKSAQA